jgi:predicted enzyme related to lactoylglutathione lyase
MAENATGKIGSFCWVELGTSDLKGAKEFYHALFSWSVVDVPMGEDSVYTIFQTEGKDVGAAYARGAEEKGVPPSWLLYVAVESADQSAERVGKLHGTILAPPFDVMEIGRMAPTQDPTGAHFALWEAKRAPNAASGPGTLCWADLNTPDPGKARAFYEGLFGWTLTTGEKSKDDYLPIRNGEDFIGGVPSEHDPKTPAHWMPYFLTTDCAASVAQGKALGAQVYFGPTQIDNVGHMAVLADPQGAVFALFGEPK